MRTIRLALATLSLGITCTVMAGQPAMQSAASKSPPPRRDPTTLVEKVRFNFTEGFKNPFTAMSVGWRNRTACVDGPDGGGNGISLLFDPSPAPGFPPPNVADGILEPTNPEAMIYEPTGNGNFRLVAVEFIELAAHWAKMVKEDSTLPPRRASTGISCTTSEPPIAMAFRRSTSCTCGRSRTIRTARSRTGIRW